MRYLKTAALVFLTVVVLAAAGCGGSSSSSTKDPFASTSASTSTGTATSTATSTDPIFGNISTVNGKTGISVTTDRPAVDVNNGQVLVTAKVISNNAAVVGVPVTFSIVAPANGTATIEAGRTTVTTDSNGEAVTRITTTNVLSTTNVLVAATAAIGTQSATANTSFQVVRGSGVIMFTDKAGLSPGDQSNLLKPGEYELDGIPEGTPFRFMQLVPFKVTDSNGNPRVGLPVSLSVYSISSLDSRDAVIDYLVPPISEQSQSTVTTDSAGQGIFNTSILIYAPAPGGVYTVSVVFKAVTNDDIPLTGYIGNIYTLKSKPVAITNPLITPTAASFGTATDITFTVAGGTTPYHVSSSNPARVSVSLQADGITVLAHLVDTSQWSDSVTISITDLYTHSSSATVTR